MSAAPLHIDSRLEETAAAAAGISERCRALGMDEANLMMVELSVVEALNNAVEHAFHGQPGHDIWAQCARENDTIVIEIWHDGEALDEATLQRFGGEFIEPDPDDPDTWTTSGRGLQIILTTMDSVETFEHDGNTGLRLRKRI